MHLFDSEIKYVGKISVYMYLRADAYCANFLPLVYTSESIRKVSISMQLCQIYYTHVSQMDMRPVVTDTEQYKSTHRSQPSM